MDQIFRRRSHSCIIAPRFSNALHSIDRNDLLEPKGITREMRKLFFLLFLTLGPLVCPTHAQSDRLNERETEWKAYALPQVSFARYTSAEKEFTFRVPSEWRQTGTQ